MVTRLRLPATIANPRVQVMAGILLFVAQQNIYKQCLLLKQILDTLSKSGRSGMEQSTFVGSVVVATD